MFIETFLSLPSGDSLGYHNNTLILFLLFLLFLLLFGQSIFPFKTASGRDFVNNKLKRPERRDQGTMWKCANMLPPEWRDLGYFGSSYIEQGTRTVK